MVRTAVLKPSTVYSMVLLSMVTSRLRRGALLGVVSIVLLTNFMYLLNNLTLSGEGPDSKSNALRGGPTEEEEDETAEATAEEEEDETAEATAKEEATEEEEDEAPFARLGFLGVLVRSINSPPVRASGTARIIAGRVALCVSDVSGCRAVCAYFRAVAVCLRANSIRLLPSCPTLQVYKY